MNSYAYYKNYFDRVTADIDFYYLKERKMKRPNYKVFYKENQLIAFYKSVPNSEAIIKKAHKLRNENPISHSSAELLNNDDTTEDLKKCIQDLRGLIYSYLLTK